MCKFYKILVINTVVTFNNSSKLILKTFDKYFLVKITTWTIRTPIFRPKVVKSPHFTVTQDTFSKVRFKSKIMKKPKACFFSSKVMKKNLIIKNPKTSRSAFFQNAQRDVLGFFLNLTFFNCF